MAAKEHRKTHDNERTEKMIPLITAETAFRQRVCELVFGFNIFDLVYLLDQMGSSAFKNHLHYCFTVFKNVTQGSEVRRLCVCGNVIHIDYLNIISVDVFLRLGVGVFPLGFVTGLPVLVGS